MNTESGTTCRSVHTYARRCREDSVSKGKKKKAKQRKQQKEDSQERSTDSEKEKKSPR